MAFGSGAGQSGPRGRDTRDNRGGRGSRGGRNQNLEVGRAPPASVIPADAVPSGATAIAPIAPIQPVATIQAGATDVALGSTALTRNAAVSTTKRGLRPVRTPTLLTAASAAKKSLLGV